MILRSSPLGKKPLKQLEISGVKGSELKLVELDKGDPKLFQGSEPGPHDCRAYLIINRNHPDVRRTLEDENDLDK